MTTPPSVSRGMRDNFDTGPLSWVMGEIREALNRSKSAIHEAVTQDTDARTTSLHHAKSYLHQAHGALQIVDVDGVAIITETVEDLLDRVETGQIALSAQLAQAIDSGCRALVEYLEELLSGVPHQPVRLFPYYRSLLEARGAERIHPADLFFPNLAVRPQFPAADKVAAPSPEHYVGLRKRFEKALLPFLKSRERSAELANASLMRDIVAEIEALQGNQHSRAFWWVMLGLAEAVADDQIDNEIYVKQLFARINLQIRRLSQGSSSIAERLLRDALFFVAKARNPSPRALQIQSTYQLGGLVPDDYDAMRYGTVDVDALGAAKERLAHAKTMWNRIAGGDTNATESFEHELRMLADSGSKLGSEPLSKLLRELKGIARHAARARPGDALGLEMATSLLFVENALNHIGRLSENFGERADAMTARLLAVVTGEAPSESAPWLDDMSREAQQRQTMAALAGEMQASLRQVEKMLDEYFRDPTQSNALDQLDKILHQIEGAMAVLDQGDAVRTIQHTRNAVQRFLDAEGETLLGEQEFQQVAQNVGALSFFIESLQLPSEAAAKRFSFDENSGVFSANLINRAESAPDEADATPQIIESSDLPTPARESDDAATVEDELASHQQRSAELAMSLTAEPGNHALQEELKESLEKIRLDATLVDNPEINDRAQAGIEILGRPGFSDSQESLAEIVNATVPVATPAAQLPPLVAPASDEAIDAELLEIFLSEAEEVLAAVDQTLPLSRQQPHNQEHLTTLRRSFHTLKGSGRMVGLVAFGEAAWSIEQVLNLRLSEARSGDDDLFALLEKASEILGAWVNDLKVSGGSGRTPDALVRAAERVKTGGAFELEDDAQEVAIVEDEQPLFAELPPLDSEVTAPEVAVDPSSMAFPQVQSEGVSELVDDLDVPLELEDEPAETINPELEAGDGREASAMPGDLPALSEAVEIEMSDAEMKMFESAVADQAPAMDVAAPAPDLQPVAAVAEVIDFPTLRETTTHHNDNIKRIGDLEISVPLHNIYLAETDELVRRLARDISEWRHEPDRDVSTQSVHAAHSLSGSSATVGFVSLQEVAHALEMVLQFLMRKPVRLNAYEFDTLEQSVERLKQMLQAFALGEMLPRQPEFARLLNSMRRDIELRAANHAAGSGEDPRSSIRTESAEAAIATALPVEKAASDAESATISGSGSEAESELVLPEHVSEPFAEPVFASEGDATADPAMVLKDELDADLLPVFLEEGNDMFPQMGAELRAWQDTPNDLALPQSLLRLLHTLKGSARMAGAMALGQHLHEMETRIENITRLGNPESLAINDVVNRYDQSLQLFERLQGPPAAEQTEAGGPGMSDQPVEGNPLVLSPVIPLMHAPGGSVATPERNHPAQPAALVRVRADILDRLVNQAGEVSISRSKLETEVGTLKNSLSELTENVSRLRDQLREIEMQAESQITSRMANSSDREFDPLEFDRFTRLQELTRMMAESVNDVGSVHQNLSRTLDSAVGGLSVQARLTRDLQQDLMRVRMVQFASISERLYRVTRQAAKEVDKRVNLDIRGSAVEIDRGVLEKMTGPFEHLLRNAIVHGIETRDERSAVGKGDIGELLVEIRQEGNEVVIQFSDDGHGLNLDRIREKAQRIGLLGNDVEMSDEEVTDMIFHPGFSTAEEVTELAGRGVGMDVVRSEAAALGGRVSTRSEAGKGTQFTIHLPLTLAVTQVVLLSTGGRMYAVPSVLVEQVQQLKTNALAAAYNDGAVQWQGQRVAMHYLSSLLGDTVSSPVSQQYSPLLILKSGNDRVALHVDEVVGNREVVVKNIGPQLARMVGIAGATVLGSGEIVLIVNPVPLAQRAAHEDQRAPRMTASDAPSAMGAVAELAGDQSPAPVQGLRRQHIVMVVDDSLTVRRVTQRLLTREGYQVVLAKDGVDALERLQSVTPDVMLVDIEMPRMDGFDLTRNVRDDQRTRHIPIVMITSRTAEKHRNYAMELGVNEYLGKPYQEEALLGLLATYIGKAITAE